MSQQWEPPGNPAPPGAWAPPGAPPPPQGYAPAPSQYESAPPPPPQGYAPAPSQYESAPPPPPQGYAPAPSQYESAPPPPPQGYESYAGDEAGIGYPGDEAEPPVTGSSAGSDPTYGTRLDNLPAEVAALKIRGGNTRVERQVRVGGAALMTIGVLLIIVAWFKASAPNTSVNNQMAYLISGGLVGIALVGIGAAVYLRSWMARLRYWQARQVVESREYTAQVLLLLARIEKLLGGTGELPGSTEPSTGSLWDTIVSPAETPNGSTPPLIGDPSLGDEPTFTDNSDLHTKELPAEVTWSDPRHLLEPSIPEPQPVHIPEPEPVHIPEPQPVYTNEHGHVWDHAAQQWYDPASHQWFDGIVGRWYRRETVPPRA